MKAGRVECVNKCVVCGVAVVVKVKLRSGGGQATEKVPVQSAMMDARCAK